MRALAGELAADPNLADDIAQEAWLRTLRGSGPGSGRFRAWIAAVVRNLVTTHHRDRARRARLATTARLATDDASEDPSAALARLEAHELLVAAVRALEEPYRTAILLRWFEGLPPRAIARRLDVPVRTVHTRLQRAMAHLRERLHARDPRWQAVLLLTPLPGRAAAATFAMTTTTKLSLFAGACAAATAAFVFVPRHDPAPAQVADATAAARPRDAAPAPEPPAGVERQIAASAAPAAEAPAEAPWQLRGVALDLDARPVANVAVTFTAFGETSPRGQATTSANGEFALSLAAAVPGNLDVEDRDWTAVYRAALWNRDVGELTLVLAPVAPVAGIVVDGTGRPLAGTNVSLIGTLPARSRFDRSLERAIEGQWQTRTRDDGTFEVARAPRLDPMQVHGRLAGYRSAQATVVARTGVRLALPRAAMLEGRVLDHRGLPIVAAVFCHPAGAMSEPDGTFRIDVSNVQSRWLVAARGGSLPARLHCPTEEPTRVESWPQPIELRLGGSPLTISGRAFDADGTPLESPSVQLLDQEFLVPGNPATMIEFLAKVDSRVTEDGAEFTSTSVGWPGQPKGGFLKGGLQDREYRLAIEDRATLRRLVTAPIRAGASGIELRFGNEPMWPGIAGIVVDRWGAAVPGASVWIEGRETPNVPESRPRTNTLPTDADGRFAHGPLVRSANKLRVQAPGVAWPTTFDLETLGDPMTLQLAAPVATRVRIAATHAGDSATFLDAKGTRIGVTITHGDQATGAANVPLTNGRSELLTVPDDAATLVLKRSGHEVVRIPVDLRPGAVQVLQP